MIRGYDLVELEYYKRRRNETKLLVQDYRLILSDRTKINF